MVNTLSDLTQPHVTDQAAKDSQHLEEVSAAYDRIGYDAGVSALTHPCELGGAVSLYGVQAPPVNQARILEVGSALGHNLIPIAASLPQSVCVGIDLSLRQVELANREAQELGLQNIVFIAAEITEVAEELNGFDYIICHGVYSWTSDEVRKRLLPCLMTLLSPRGILHVSYNTYPGWADCGLLRSLVQTLSSKTEWTSAQEPQVDQWISSLPQGSTRRRYEQLWFGAFRDQPDFYKRHGIFAEFNQPRYVSDMIAEAEAAGLSYITDASPQRDLPTEDFREVMTHSKGLTRADQLQLLDFARHTTFRASLFTRSSEYKPDGTLTISSLSRLYLYIHLVQTEVDTPSDSITYYQGRFEALEQPLEMTDPLLNKLIKSAAIHWPAPLPLKTYLTQVDSAMVDNLVAQLLILISHNQASLFFDWPKLPVCPRSNLVNTESDRLDADKPLISKLNAYYISKGRPDLTVCGLHQSTKALREAPWFPMSDLFNGKRDRKELLQAVLSHSAFPESKLAKMSELERGQQLDQDLSLFDRLGYV